MAKDVQPVELTGSYAELYPRGEVIFEDTFKDGSLDGWEWLMSGVKPISGPTWSTRRGNHGGGSMLLQTGDALDEQPFGSAVGIKRLTMPYKGGLLAKVGGEWEWGFSSDFRDRPRAIDFGFDTQTPGVPGQRRWYKVRFQNVVDGSGEIANKWQVLSGDAYVDIPGTEGFTIWNEGKSNLMVIKLVANLQTQKYESFYINGRTFDLSFAVSPTLEPYAAYFEHGLNYTVEVRNRGANTLRPNWCRTYVTRVRGTVE